MIGEVPGRSRVANQSIELNALIPKQFDNDPASRFLVQYSDDFKIPVEAFAISSFAFANWMSVSLKFLFGSNEFS